MKLILKNNIYIFIFSLIFVLSLISSHLAPKRDFVFFEINIFNEDNIDENDINSLFVGFKDYFSSIAEVNKSKISNLHLLSRPSPETIFSEYINLELGFIINSNHISNYSVYSYIYETISEIFVKSYSMKYDDLMTNNLDNLVLRAGVLKTSLSKAEYEKKYNGFLFKDINNNGIFLKVNAKNSKNFYNVEKVKDSIDDISNLIKSDYENEFKLFYSSGNININLLKYYIDENLTDISLVRSKVIGIKKIPQQVSIPKFTISNKYIFHFGFFCNLVIYLLLYLFMFFCIFINIKRSA